MEAASIGDEMVGGCTSGHCESIWGQAGSGSIDGERRELDWMVRLQASQEKDITDSTRIVASPGMTRIGEHASVAKQK